MNDCWRFNLTTAQWSLLSLKSGAANHPQSETLAAATAVGNNGDSPVQAAAAAVPSAQPLLPVAGHQVIAWHGSLLLLGGHVKVFTRKNVNAVFFPAIEGTHEW